MATIQFIHSFRDYTRQCSCGVIFGIYINVSSLAQVHPYEKIGLVFDDLCYDCSLTKAKQFFVNRFQNYPLASKKYESWWGTKWKDYAMTKRQITILPD